MSDFYDARWLHDKDDPLPARPTTTDLYRTLRRIVTATPMPVNEVIARAQAEHRIDQEEIVAALWDLIEDEDWHYDASGQVRS